MTTPFLRVASVTKRYDDHFAVRDVSLELLVAFKIPLGSISPEVLIPEVPKSETVGQHVFCGKNHG